MKDLQQHLARNPQRAARFFCRAVDAEKAARRCSFFHQECRDYPPEPLGKNERAKDEGMPEIKASASAFKDKESNRTPIL
ncbi:MAG: hypothetical protein EBT06_13440 [Gammaproteobacteria bacterium]|nr:hypothetical protein [Gammaproteobacteria bacterium]NBT45884.1 hypothetical protein [Gammaproteobacteria bacterium]